MLICARRAENAREDMSGLFEPSLQKFHFEIFEVLGLSKSVESTNIIIIKLDP